MYAVGRIGSYITRGVYTVSGSFHPFGGAVDIIVVEQPDGSSKSSPWYVRFGKFQGVLKTKEKIVSINVNGIEADFHMYLDHRGEAYFLKEGDVEEGESVLYASSSSDVTDGQSNSNSIDFINQSDASNKKVVVSSGSHRAELLGFVYERKSMKDNGHKEGEGDANMSRLSSLECAEIAADLLEVKWSSNLASDDSRKDNSTQFSAAVLDDKVLEHLEVKDDKILVESSVNDDRKNTTVDFVSDRETVSLIEQMDGCPFSSSENLETFTVKTSKEMSCIDTVEQVVEASLLGEDTVEANCLKDDEILVESSVYDDGKNRTDDSVSERESASLIGQIDGCPLSSSENLETSTVKTGIEISCIDTVEQVVETSLVGENTVEANCLIVSEISKTTDNFGIGNADHVFPDSLIEYKLEECHRELSDEEHACDVEDTINPGCRISEGSESDRVQSSEYCEASERSIIGLDNSNNQAQETLYLTSGGCGEVCVHIDTVHVTTEILSKDTDVQQGKHIDQEKELAEVSDMDTANPIVMPESYPSVVCVEPALRSTIEVDSQNICTTLNVSSEVQDGLNIKDDVHQSLCIGDSKRNYSGIVMDKAGSDVESLEEEQFLFSDFDEFKVSEVQCIDSSSVASLKKDNHLAYCGEGIQAVNGLVNANGYSCCSSDVFAQYNPLNDLESSLDKSPRVMSSPISVPGGHKAVEEVGFLAESLPNMWSPTIDLSADDSHFPVRHSLDLDSEPLNWTLLNEIDSSCTESDADKEQPNVDNSQELKRVLSSPTVGDRSETIVSPRRSWSLWPFSRRGSKTRKATQPAQTDAKSSDAAVTKGSDAAVSKSSDAAVTSESINGMNETNDVCKPKMEKKMVRAITPTSKQLASLNLKEGKNTVTFTFSTAMLGKQQVDARIYLWKWNARIVISDVDGTITKSDVLGQFMPMVGIDWSQTGVTHLFSAIKENGYQLLFLSARAISQSHITRQFLFSLKQDGKGLPDGPVVISPDGVFPSLFREVIRRAPHEFKIACLEDIRALFPSDHNPFYAGFGNRDTDEISYLKVGIPKGKIFIINPKGEVAVSRHVRTKSYSSLHAIVDDIFPDTTTTTTTTSEREDFNSWNFWKLSPPQINA
ncbi:phosphatidate phosphatase PAH2-like isoform X2 [Mangifera indica]|uniref:phosphatidate phosphatase PAH2-like isoform X2 n=1 Tax=Mangifera indica TaxID=29780 RepID=UPI001CFA99E8|nr:phosphatidate phosphatase PAH2-like isoform X2 [Mangifera indica]